MNQEKPFSNSKFLIAAITFLLGTAFGLFVLGWWLWPVNWVDASVEALNPAAQNDYLRAAIDAYSYNHDEQIALQRYVALGSSKEQILLEISSSPETLTTAEIENFAIAIGAQGVLTGETLPPTSAPTSPNGFDIKAINPVWLIALLIALGIGFMIFVIIILIIRNKNKKQQNSEEGEISIKTFDTPDEFSVDEGQSEALAETQPTSKFRKYEATDEIEEGELPDWLLPAGNDSFLSQEETQDEDRTVELSDKEYEELSSPGFPFMPEKSSTLDSETQQPAVTQPHEASTTISESSLLKMSHNIETSADMKSNDIGSKSNAEMYHKFSQDISSLPGLSEDEARILKDIGISAPLLLLKNGASTQGRQSLSNQSQIEPSRILELVNFIDLFRIKGLTIEDARLLKSAGIFRMTELAGQDTDALFTKLENVYNKTDESRNLPAFDQVRDWIEQAKQLPQVVVE